MLFDDWREHFLELIGRRVVGVLAELLDASGEGGVRNDRRDCFHGAIDAAGLDGGAHAVDIEFAFDERLKAFTMIVVERLDGRGQLFVGGGLDRAVEETQRLHAVLDVIHGQRRYR